MWARLVDHAKAAAVEYAENRQAPRGSSSVAAVSSPTPAWDTLRASLRETAQTVLQNAEIERGGQPAQAAAGFLSSVGSALVDAAERKVKQSAMPSASDEVLRLSLLAARLADVAYSASAEQAQDKLARITNALELVEMRCQKDALPQWLLIRRRDNTAVYVVFRGTESQDDVHRDLLFMPEANGGLRFHSGFLAGVRDDDELVGSLHALLDGSNAHLYLIGHSLGGSLALALPCVTPTVAPACIPPTHAGEVTVVAIGSPAVIHGPLDGGASTSAGTSAASASSSSSSSTSAFPAAAPCVGVPVQGVATNDASHSGTGSSSPAHNHEAPINAATMGFAGLDLSAGGADSVSAVAGTPLEVPIGVPIIGTVLPPGAGALPRHASRCRAVLVVNAADAVPRLLGSPLPFATSSLFSEIIKQTAARRAPEGQKEQAVADARAGAQELLDTLPAYVHLPQTEMVLLRTARLRPLAMDGDGSPARVIEAIAVPPTERHLALHVHESFSVNALHHHHLDEYITSLEAATRRAPAHAGRAHTMR